MKISDLSAHNQYYDIVLSQFAIIDQNDDLTGVVDIPISGILVDDKHKEVKLVIRTDDVKFVADMMKVQIQPI